MLSIIVPARNCQKFTTDCLASILYSISRLNVTCEFILIDDNSDPDERILEVFFEHRAKASRCPTRIVHCRKHQHYTGVFSIGLHLASHDVIFFISNDMYVTPNFIEALLLVSALSPEFGIVRGTSNHPDSHPEHRVPPPNRPMSYTEIEKFSREIFASNMGRYTEDRVLSGDAVLLKRSLIDRIGVLDMRFFGYFGDVDYGTRARLAGFKLVCAKGAWLFHEGGGHVTHEIVKQRFTLEEQRVRRMTMVSYAYQEFRKKWGIEHPAQFGDLSSLDFVEQVRPNAERAGLKYDFPTSVLHDLEFL